MKSKRSKVSVKFSSNSGTLGYFKVVKYDLEKLTLDSVKQLQTNCFCQYETVYKIIIICKVI
jgi:hypothetical protein